MHPQDITPCHCGLGSQGSPPYLMYPHIITTTSGLESSTPFPRTPAPQAIQDPVGSLDIHPTSQVMPWSPLCCTVEAFHHTNIPTEGGPHLSSSYRGSPGLVPPPRTHPSHLRKPSLPLLPPGNPYTQPSLMILFLDPSSHPTTVSQLPLPTSQGTAHFPLGHHGPYKPGPPVSWDFSQALQAPLTSRA